MTKLQVPTKWKTIVALFLALIALTYNLMMIWGVFCWFWGWENFRTKEAYFVERVERSKNPILYGVIVASWFLMGFLYFYMDTRIYMFFWS